MHMASKVKVEEARAGGGQADGGGGVAGTSSRGVRGRRLRQRLLGLLAGVGLVFALTAATPPAPASGWSYYWPTNTMTPMLLADGCYLRLQYGNFGSTAYGRMRMYGGSMCGQFELHLWIADSYGSRWLTNASTGAGTDSCGSYFERFVQQSNAYGLRVLALGPYVWRELSLESSYALPAAYHC